MVATATQQAQIMPAPATGNAEAPIVIVGNGPSGMQCLVQLRRLGVRTPILLFGKEHWAPYDRVKLSSFLAGVASFDSLANLPAEVDDNVVHYVGREVVSVCTDSSTLLDSTGSVHCYSKLILALGSRAYVPATPGGELSGVFRFRDMTDAHALIARTARSRHTVVIGGGLLGIEAARGLGRLNTAVTLVQHSEGLMNRQLDAEAAGIVRCALEKEGVAVKLKTSVKAIGGNGRVEYVVLGNSEDGGGEKLLCDSVVFATGILPNRELASHAGIRVAQGVRVDKHMRTSHANVYAIGECAQYGEHISGLVAPGLQQARVAAAHIAGKPEVYAPVADTTWLKVLSLEVFSAGEFRDEDRFRIHRSLVFRHAESGVYRRIMLRAGRVIGIVSIGEWSQRAELVTLLRDNRRLLPWQLLRFLLRGDIVSESSNSSVASWPQTALICQCKSLTHADLRRALPECAGSVIELKKITGAGTVCGGCEPLLQNLCGSAEPVQRQVPGAKILTIVALLTVAMLAVAFTQPLPKVAASVAGQSLFEIWSRDSWLRQISGYGLLTVSVLAMLLPLRKRIPLLSFGSFSSWRIAHAVIGLLSVGILLWHTGFELGENLNRWLMTSYLLVIGWGALVAFLAVAESRFVGQWPGQWRRYTGWIHLLFFWPVPLLLSFHIIAAYFF